jgi:hemerythrin
MRRGYTPDCGAIERKQHNPHCANRNCNRSLLAEIATALSKHERDENKLTRARYREHKRAHGRVIRTVNEHRADKRNEYAPVAHDDLGEPPCERQQQG